MIKKMFMAILGSIALVAGLFVGAGTAAAAPTVPVGPGTGFFLDGNVQGCTITAVGRDSANRLVALSVGHCARLESTGTFAPVGHVVRKMTGQGSQSPAIGTVTATRTYTPTPNNAPSKTNLDYSIILLDENVVIPRTDSEDNNVHLSSIGNGSLFQNACKDGASTGFTCGLILFNGPIWQGSYAASFGGDSGSPFVVGTKLVGLLAGLDPSNGSTQFYKINETLAAINATGGVGAGFHL